MIINRTGGFRGGDSPSWSRSDRLREESGKWYFRTREGTVEGPYADRGNAESELDTYIKLKISDNSDSRVPPRPDSPSVLY